MNDEYVKYYKRRYLISFYRELPNGDEEFVESFDNVNDICKYKKLKITENNLSLIKTDLYRVLKKDPPITRMLDGTEMRVYLVDMLRDDDEEERLEQERRDKCMPSKKYVKISSTMNIEVYESLDAIATVTGNNMTGNRLNARSGWAKIRVLITAGTSWYPSEILNSNDNMSRVSRVGREGGGLALGAGVGRRVWATF